MTAVTEKLGTFNTENEVKPEEEVLGSVTHETLSTERPIQLRTSARVSKKLRLDLQTNAATAPVVEKKETKPEEKVTEQKSSTVRRVHELWSTEDKNAFFEALNEYGKDFDAIQTHMNNKRKKRGINHSISKNRDQARHFYYRTWHKISKYLEFPQEVKKAVREQYGLINFGEFRKKVGFVSEKNSVKLNELIYSGSTQVRIKGKTVRIKTPVCRALRKLNQLQETTADVKLPTRINIELRPRNKESWCRVQSLAMNPRVRTTLPLHQQLITLITYLQKKWQPSDAKLKEKSTSHNADIKSEPVDSDIPLLRIAPKQGINIVAPSVRSGEFVTSSRISLLAYEEKFGIEGQAISESLKQTANKNTKSSRNVKKQHVEDEKSKAKEEIDTQSQSVLQSDKPLSDKDFVSSTVNQLLSLNSEIDPSTKEPGDENEWNSPVKDDFELDNEISASENKEEIIERAKAGWNIKNAEAIRIGDLYLMFGIDSKLQLDYWWEDPVIEKELKTSESVAESSNNDEKNKLSESLRKLLSIAKLFLTKDKSQCTCGHICKPNNKVVNGRTRVMNKVKVTTNINSTSESDRLLNVSAESTSKNHITNVTVNRLHSNYVPSRTTSSFKEQLDLQYYNRRRSGDKQRSLPSIPKVTIQVIKPKEGDRVEVREEKNDSEIGKDHSAEITSKLNINNTINNNNSVFNQLPLFPDNICDKDLLLQDEDAKSSCSTITRFLKQALPEVIPQPINPSPDGFTTPLISHRIVGDVDLNQSNNGRASPTLSMASSFSIGSLLAQLDNPKTASNPPVPLDEDTRFSTDVETQFQRLINESSVDYTEKFASLAAQMASENNAKI